MNYNPGRKLVLTVDYEIFGNGTGDVRQHVSIPAKRMCAIAEKFGVPVTVFFEIEEYLAFERYAGDLRRLLGYDPAAEMRKQAADLARRGHDVQLHIHPQWYEASLERGEWQLRHDRLTVDGLFKTQEETTAYIQERKAALEAISGQPVMTYRAGGFAAQPGGRLLQALAESGFSIESSVVKGMHRPRPHPLDYRSAPKGRRHWKISDEVTSEDTQGPLWEIPVHSVMGRRYQQLTFNRLKAKFSRNVPRARQREIMEQLGVRRSPAGVLSFLWRPVPIKLDYHNLSPAVLYRMITRAPAAMDGDLDVLVLIGHTKEHMDDGAFESFLKRISVDRSIRVVTFPEIARELEELSARNPAVI